jgi:hypothetical protein
MSLPLFTSTQVCDALRSLNTGFEVFDEFPQTMENVRHGIYVNDPAIGDRTPYSLAVNYGGNIYVASDLMTIILVTFQGDVDRDKAVQAIQNLVADNVLLDGYHERDYDMTQDYINRAEYRTYTFNLKRLEFQ